MAATGQDEVIYAGNRHKLRFVVRDLDEPAVAGVFPVLDLTPFTVRWALSRGTTESYSTEATLNKSSANPTDVDLTDAVSGIAVVNLFKVDTENLSGAFYQELELVDGAGQCLVVAVSNISILRNVVNV